MPKARVRVRIRSLLSTRDLLSKHRQLMQCCVQHFTLLEVIVDGQMINEIASCHGSLNIEGRLLKS